MSSDQTTGQREPLLQWYTRKPIAWVGTGVAGVGLVLGIIGSVLAGSASSNAQSYGDAIRIEAQNPSYNVPENRTSQPCGARDDPGGDLPDFRNACGILREELDAYDVAMPLAVTGWIVFGVGVVGTATYAMLDWYPKKQKAVGDGPRLTAVTPVISAEQAGLGIAGTF